MTQKEVAKIAKEYVDQATKGFLKRHSLESSFESLKQNAEVAAKTNGVVEYFNTLINGVVDAVVSSSGKSTDTINEEFARFYLTGN